MRSFKICTGLREIRSVEEHTENGFASSARVRHLSILVENQYCNQPRSGPRPRPFRLRTASKPRFGGTVGTAAAAAAAEAAWAKAFAGPAPLTRRAKSLSLRRPSDPLSSRSPLLLFSISPRLHPSPSLCVAFAFSLPLASDYVALDGMCSCRPCRLRCLEQAKRHEGRHHYSFATLAALVFVGRLAVCETSKPRPKNMASSHGISELPEEIAQAPQAETVRMSG